MLLLSIYAEFMEGLSQLLNSPYDAAVFVVCALAIGMSKTGIQGVVMLCIPFMAQVFGAKESTGVVLPMLCFADIVAVVYYRRGVNKKCLAGLIPAAVAGFFVAILADRFVEPRHFKYLMGSTILLGLAIMLFADKFRETMRRVCQSKIYANFFGLLGGFTTMIGNAAGPVMGVYMLSVKLPKLEFVGTSAWFFMIVNYLKLPLQVFVWDNISSDILVMDMFAVPFLFAGAFLGIVFVKKIPEEGFRLFIKIATALSAVMLFF